ncbi:MAG: ACT domain-containing protein, partial [Rhodoglobus sp.]
MTAISDLDSLLATMEPELNPGVFVFATVAALSEVDLDSVIALMVEVEGISVVMRESDALRQAIAYDFRSAWITLTVNSALEAVGLTATFAQALGDVQISCNVIAGRNHDHIFV